jgi:putative oxidoreductase
MQFYHFIARAYCYFLKAMDFLTPFFDLAARLWVGNIFLKAGILKVQNWPGTLYLFEYEFHVPLLPSSWAAILGTGAEIILPILLFLGLGGRFIILVFFIYNLISTISYPFLWTPEGGQALSHHICWGLLLGLLMCHGSGKFSVDYWLRKKYGEEWKYTNK